MKIITIARKSLSERTVASNVLKHGCGALNVDGCRVGEDVDTRRDSNVMGYHGNVRPFTGGTESGGRWPSNLLLLGRCPVDEMDRQSGVSIGNIKKPYVYSDRQYDNASSSMFNGDKPQAPSNYADHGGASRFFKCFK